jgi:hypothetical protein
MQSCELHPWESTSILPRTEVQTVERHIKEILESGAVRSFISSLTFLRDKGNICKIKFAPRAIHAMTASRLALPILGEFVLKVKFIGFHGFSFLASLI